MARKWGGPRPPLKPKPLPRPFRLPKAGSVKPSKPPKDHPVLPFAEFQERFCVMKLHPSLTEEVLMDAAERRQTCLDNPGFCIRCGNEQDGCEPDARGYECESCGEAAVYGAEELLLGSLNW